MTATSAAPAGARRTPLDALRVELFAPVASFRDPMFPGVTRCLPVPALSTVRGMLAAATGRPHELVRLGMAASAAGEGVDLETYHPIASDGSNPAVGGRVRPGKGGATVRERPFLTGVRVTLWIPGADGRRIEAALRRPTWGLRLGRSQDLVYLRGRPRWTVLDPTAEAMIGHALAPPDGHSAPEAVSVRLAETVSTDRLRTVYGLFLWCPTPAGRGKVRGAYRDEGTGEAVWLHGIDGADGIDIAGSAEIAGSAGNREGAHHVGGPHDAGLHRDLDQVLAKSATGSAHGRPESLTDHSAAVRDAARAVAERIGPAGPIAAEPRFWTWVEQAALLHDAGKVAAGFQRQLRARRALWGERHEVFSLAYVDLLTAGQPDRDRLMTATGVAFHHRPLTVSGGLGDGLADRYPYDGGWERRFGRNPEAVGDEPRAQVTPTRHAALLAWFTSQLAVTLPPPDGRPPDGRPPDGRPPDGRPPESRRLWQRARDLFAMIRDGWIGPVTPETGLLAVLLQGAVTLADHSGSAHVPLQRHMPLPQRFLDRLATPYDHQRSAAAANGHLIVTAPTGSGKTEAGLAWASAQLAAMPGRPRLVWVLPYRASIDAAVDRFTQALDPAPGEDRPDIGVLHSTAARTLLTRAVAEDCAPSAADARKARARAGAMRLFAQRVRVATPHQLLRAAIAGPRYSSVLLEQANALFVLDELHAYDPVTFGRICAALRLWEQLGSRVAVLSATLPPAMIELVECSLSRPVTAVPAAAGTAPDRHRLVLDDEPVTSPASLKLVTDWLAEGRSVLVVANTVATAQILFRALAPAAHAVFRDGRDAAVLLHSRFKARDRATIEQRILARHPERRPGDPVLRQGGLVVSTQALEVSLCLDFDRGVSELAPIEAVAQRAGRVNRRGRHPDGPVEFRVHAVPSHLPYEEEALNAAWAAMQRTVSSDQRISEHTIGTWLADVYATAWGRQWTRTARQARDEFAAAFLTFRMPFEDRGEFAGKLDESFDTVHVLHIDDVDEYRSLSDKRDGDPLLAEGLLIPIRYGQYARLLRDGCAHVDRGLKLAVVDLPYTPETGLDLVYDQETDVRAPAAPVDTVL